MQLFLRGDKQTPPMWKVTPRVLNAPSRSRSTSGITLAVY